MAKQHRSEQTRNEIVRCAARLFDRDGFPTASMSEISQAAGVTKGAVYFHFASKDELVGAVQELGCVMLESHAAKLASNEDSPLQTVIDLTHTLAAWLDASPVIRACMRTARECADRGAPFSDFYQAFLKAIKDALARASAAGELKTGLAQDAVLTQVVAAATGLEVLWWAGTLPRPRTEAVSKVWEVLLPGIAVPARTGRIERTGSSTAAARPPVSFG
ncbi:ScbR family autoregulator-binding transcription factor [Amycolatopsis magusensis]|uniref:ScbR family autoregulator-binding transcription factor n=1 Tax=Amycolatopsis magusensis TaxID=882444 RepID=UPI0037AC105D